MKFYERVISDFGGYEKCKDILSQPNIDFIMNAHGLREHMLEYRRQHNIFEVGDKVVIRKADGHPDLFTYESISKSGNMHFFESPFNYGHLDLCKVRHATDAEIKAGRRL